MPIVKNTASLLNYPIRHLDRGFVEGVESAWINPYSFIADTSQKHLLHYLDCYSDLTDQRLSLDDLAGSDFGRVILEFGRVLKGSSLIELKDSYLKSKYFELFINSLRSLSKSLFSYEPEWLAEAVWDDLDPLELEESNFSNEQLTYWSSWQVVDRKGKSRFLELASLHESHGPKFTTEFYTRLRAHFAKGSVSNTYVINIFAKFLAENKEQWPASTFKNPLSTSLCFNAFLKHYFLFRHNKGLDLSNSIKSWNSFTSQITQVFFEPGVWAEPFGDGLPRVSDVNKRGRGTKTRISKNSDGVEVHNKLLTEVPLQYTDDQAIEILFNNIGRDLNIVKQWAQAKARSLSERQKQRIKLAQVGTPLQHADLGHYPKSLNSVEFKDACATFEKYGFDPKYAKDKTSIFRLISKVDLAYKLGMPTRDSLFPFMALLVLEHPEITPSYLSELDLYNERNQLSGFTKTDSGYQLTGYKDRRKKKLSEQKIQCTETSESLIKQVIEITEPLRVYLRAKGDSNWRKLFLTSGQAFNFPKAGVVSPWKANHSWKKPSQYALEKECEFSEFTDFQGEKFRDFAARISLSSIRASAGVLVFLRTKSVHKMAEALGHERYQGNILEAYLPDSILAFFQTRWIRIFQRAFICHALKDSPYILQAANFGSMTDLHVFLANHALDDIPAHLSDPEQAASTEERNPENEQVLVSINPGILTALLSLKQAVSNSSNPGKISGLAHYWSNISTLIEKEIANGTDALLKNHLAVAKGNLNPQKMERLIYDTAA